MSNLSKDLNKRITLYELKEISDNFGTIRVQRSDVATVWAMVSVISNKPWLDFDKQDSTAYYRIIIRFVRNVKVGQYVSYQGKHMKIQDVINDEVNHITTKIIAEERAYKAIEAAEEGATQ